MLVPTDICERGLKLCVAVFEEILIVKFFAGIAHINRLPFPQCAASQPEHAVANLTVFTL